MKPITMRHHFFKALWRELHLVWPIFSGLLIWPLVLGFIVGRIEDWPWGDGLYFTFITLLTIGYGDLVPHRPVARLLAVLIGFSGVLLTGLIVAVAVKALNTTTAGNGRDRG